MLEIAHGQYPGAIGNPFSIAFLTAPSRATRLAARPWVALD